MVFKYKIKDTLTQSFISWLEFYNIPHSYEVDYSKSSYNNYRNTIVADIGLEYSIYPFSNSNSKFLVVRFYPESELRQ
jgi:hypothetical protein